MATLIPESETLTCTASTAFIFYGGMVVLGAGAEAREMDVVL